MIRKREIWCREFLPYSEMMMIARRRTMRPEITKTTPRRHRFRFSFFPSRFLHHILLHCIDYALLRWPVLLSLDTRTLSSSCAADEWQTARGSLVSSPSSNEEAEVLLPRLSLRWQIWVADDYVMLVFLGTLFLFSFFFFSLSEGYYRTMDHDELDFDRKVWRGLYLSWNRFGKEETKKKRFH